MASNVTMEELDELYNESQLQLFDPNLLALFNLYYMVLINFKDILAYFGFKFVSTSFSLNLSNFQ